MKPSLSLKNFVQELFLSDFVPFETPKQSIVLLFTIHTIKPSLVMRYSAVGIFLGTAIECFEFSPLDTI